MFFPKHYGFVTSVTNPIAVLTILGNVNGELKPRHSSSTLVRQRLWFQPVHGKNTSSKGMLTISR